MAETHSNDELSPTTITIRNYELVKLHQSFSSIYFRFAFNCKQWLLYRICMCKSAAIISGIILSHKLVNIVVIEVLITYLTDTWETDYILHKAATFASCQEGLSKILVIITTLFSDTYIGSRMTILYSSTVLITGLGLLATLSIVSPSKFGPLNMIGMLFLSASKAVKPLLESFLSEQLKAHEHKGYVDENRVEARTNAWCHLAKLVSAILALFVFSSLGWPATFASSAFLVVGVYFFFFLLGNRFIHYKQSTVSGSPLAHCFGVVKAAFLKRHLNYPSSTSELYERDDNQPRCLPQVKFLRWLDKAAVIETSSGSSDPEVQEKVGRLYTVKQVKETKLLLTMLPMWTAYIGLSIGISTADVLFPEQENNLHPDIPVIMLVVLKFLSGYAACYLYDHIVSNRVPCAKLKFCQLLKIGIAMFLSVVCLTIAWRVEVYRVKVIKDHNLLDNSKHKIPMSPWLLTPQFVISGIVEQFAESGLDGFFSGQVPYESLQRYGSSLNDFCNGIGSFITVFLIQIFKSCFGKTPNRSRMDKYYMIVAAVCFINFSFNAYVASLYSKGLSVEEDVINPETRNPKLFAMPPLHVKIDVMVQKFYAAEEARERETEANDKEEVKEFKKVLQSTGVRSDDFLR